VTDESNIFVGQGTLKELETELEFELVPLTLGSVRPTWLSMKDSAGRTAGETLTETAQPTTTRTDTELTPW
jgi:hypothetical protein